LHGIEIYETHQFFNRTVFACVYNTSVSSTKRMGTSNGGSSNDRSNSVTTDDQNNIITTGFFNGTVDFDPGVGVLNLTSAGLGDIFIQKLTPNGEFIWSVRIGGTGNDAGQSVSTSINGDIIVTGFFTGTVDFDPGPGVSNLTSAGNTDIFVCRLTSTGNFISAFRMGSAGLDQGLSVISDSVGNIYVTGLF
jgi:hypothetical protein